MQNTMWPTSYSVSKQTAQGLNTNRKLHFDFTESTLLM